MADTKSAARAAQRSRIKTQPSVLVCPSQTAMRRKAWSRTICVTESEDSLCAAAPGGDDPPSARDFSPPDCHGCLPRDPPGIQVAGASVAPRLGLVLDSPPGRGRVASGGQTTEASPSTRRHDAVRLRAICLLSCSIGGGTQRGAGVSPAVIIETRRVQLGIACSIAQQGFVPAGPG